MADVTRSLPEPRATSNAGSRASSALTETAEWRRQVSEHRAVRAPGPGSRVATVALVVAFVGVLVVLVSADRALAGRDPDFPVLVGVTDARLRVSVWITGIRKQIRWRGRTYDAAQTRFGAER